MPNSTVPGLPTATTPNGTELYYCVQSGQDRKVTGQQLVGSAARVKLTANTTYYVSTTGADQPGNGTLISSPWLTLQYALNQIATTIDFCSFVVTVQLAAGTVGTPNVYAGCRIPDMVGGGYLLIESSSTDPLTTKIRGTTNSIAAIINNITTTVGLGGVWLECSTNAGALITLGSNADMFLGTTNRTDLILGQVGTDASYWMIEISDHGTMVIGTAEPNHAGAPNITLDPKLTAGGYVSCSGAGQFYTGSAVYVIDNSTETPAWFAGFIKAYDGGNIGGLLKTGVGGNITGNSTGNKYRCLNGGIISIINTLLLLPGDTFPSADNTSGGFIEDLVVGRSYMVQVNAGQPSVTTGEITFATDTSSSIYTFNYQSIQSATTLSSNLPAAGSNTGRRMIVSDSSTSTFFSTFSGGGANTVPVFSDGTNWRIG